MVMMERLRWSGMTGKGGGRRGGTLKLGKRLGAGVLVPSEQWSIRTFAAGEAAGVVMWRVPSAKGIIGQKGQAAEVWGESGIDVCG
jgi:hypothetical protein